MVEVARRKGADHKPVDLKGLVDRRRQVHRAGDRLKIIRVERERVKVAVPAHDIMRVTGHDVPRETIPILGQHGEIALLIHGENLARAVKIALAVGRAHPDLALFMQVALGNADGMRRLEDQVVFLGDVVGHEPVDGAARDDDIVVRLVAEPAVLRLEPAAAGPDKDDVVALAVAVEVILLRHRGRGAAAVGGDVGVEHQRHAAGVGIARAGHRRGLQVVVPQRGVRGGLERELPEQLDALHPRRGLQVIDDGVGAVEALSGDDVLVVQALAQIAGGLVAGEPEVMLAGQRPESEVLGHGEGRLKA